MNNATARLINRYYSAPLAIVVLAILMILALSLCSGCTEIAPAPHTACLQQAEAACDVGDTECTRAVMDDCAPPAPCTAPDGQHCATESL